MAKKWIVLKPTGPMNLANGAGLKIKQGQVVEHPGYPIDPKVFGIFEDEKKAQQAAEKNAELKNISTRHGITDMKTMARIRAQNARAPSQADREKAAKDAKVLTPEGLVDPNADRVRELEEEVAAKDDELKKLKGTINPAAYLDQNFRTVLKRVTNAVKKGKLKKDNVKAIIEAEQTGQKRKTIFDGLRKLVENDALFGKLIKKKKR